MILSLCESYLGGNMNLKKVRKDSHMTLSELGTVFSVSESTIHHYESGRRKLDINVLIKYADYFNVSIDYLVGRENESTAYERPNSLTEIEFSNACKLRIIDKDIRDSVINIINELYKHTPVRERH